MRRRFSQVDVFAAAPFRGNPVAVVLDTEGLDADEMQAFARWTNLSETTFVLPPTADGADYRVRIFTPAFELPFAGHPTLGTCRAWLRAQQAEAGGPRVVVQECGAGLVRVRVEAETLAFAAPPLVRSGPVEDEVLDRVVEALRIRRADVRAAAWVDNGPGWVAVLLADADAVLALRPGPVGDLMIGAVGPRPPDSPEAVEVRAFFPAGGVTVEDPVTGSLNASLAPWLVGDGVVTLPYTARQGTALGREGRVRLSEDPADGTLWVGGTAVVGIDGWVDL